MNFQRFRIFSGISGCSERDGLGDCSNVCLPSKEGHVCACADGHQMIEDGNTGSTCDNGRHNLFQ